MCKLSLILACLLFILTGCSTTYDARYGNSSAGTYGYDYDKFLDSYEGYKLVRRHEDIYIEKTDGSESRRITHTPHVRETSAFITKDKAYIVYSEYVGWSNFWGASSYRDSYKIYLVDIDGDDSTRKEISFEESHSLGNERRR